MQPNSCKYFILICITFSICFSLSCASNSICNYSSQDQISINNQRLFHQQAIFVSGQNGYHTYRIPALTVTQQGAILAFCEGRQGGGDSGNIDMVMRRSTDCGQTWEPMQILWDDDGNTCGNPAPVVDRDTGTIWLLMTHNNGKISERDINHGKGTRDVWVMHSKNDGQDWSEPKKISLQTKNADWRWYATGPCHGIQMQNGRMIIPCDHSTGPEFDQWNSHIIYSDDHGQTWRIGGIEPGAFTNECTIVELTDNSLYLNMRSYRGDHRRQISTSNDNGLTWTKAQADQALIEPRCQGAAIRYTSKPEYSRNRILFSNPASEKREKMTIRISYDEAKTWQTSKRIYEGPSAYSDLAILPDGTVACFYERGEKHPYETITFARMTLAWLTDGQDALKSR